MKAALAGVVLSTTISSLGTGMTMLAIPWFVLESTGQGVDTGLVVAAEATGLLLGSASGGPWIDRLRPRHAALLFDFAAAAMVVLIPVLHHLERLPLWLLATIGLLLGLSRSPGDAARQVLLPDIAQRTGIALERVTTAYDAPSQGARTLGAPVAGVVIAAVGAPAALAINALCLVLAGLILRLTVAEAATFEQRQDGYLRSLAEGFRFLRHDRPLCTILCMIAITNGLNSGIFSVLVPTYGQEVLNSSVHVGLIFAASGVGMITGSLLFAWLGVGWRRWPVVVVCYLIVLGPRSGIFLLQPDLTVLVIVSGLTMLAFGPLNPILGAVKAERTPPAYHARVFGAIAAAAMLGMPVGVFVAGVLSDHIGLMPSITVFTVLSAVMSLCPLTFPSWKELDRPTRTQSTEPAGSRA